MKITSVLTEVFAVMGGAANHPWVASFEKADDSVSIEDPGMLFKGTRSKCKAGYLRATAAAILRQARPNLFAYGSSLWRLGANPDYFENAIVMRLKF